jgi:hypothetical protein
MNTKRKQIGNNLVDTSIALSIIALLLGAVIKGPEIVDNAKVKKLATDFRNIPVFLNSYHSMYKTYPGDDATIGTANSHLPNATKCTATASGSCNPGDGVIEGNWNDITPASETFVIWQHMRLAGLVTGATAFDSPDYLPQNAVGRMMGVQSGTADVTKTPINSTSGATPIRGAFIVCSQGIMGKLAKMLDNMMDDGNTATGYMMAGIPTAPGTPMTAVATLNDSTLYTVCMGI